MKRSNPDCKNYISEDLCAGSTNRPESHCHDDARGDCSKYAPKTAAADGEAVKSRSTTPSVTTLDIVE